MTASAPPPPTGAFGTVFGESMVVAEYTPDGWVEPRVVPTEPFSLHPATHVLHYASACFEGLKAHRDQQGAVRIFRLDAHVARMQQSAETLMLPVPGTEMLSSMVTEAVKANKHLTPAQPGSLYLRPTLIGTEPNIGAAAVPSKTALLYILTSPVGDYFAGGVRPLRLEVETETPRTTPQFGRVKSGANYVMALGPTMKAKRESGADQVLFAPGGQVQETGAANFMLIDSETIVTPALSDAFLHGVTRSSLLAIGADLGYRIEERAVTVDDMVAWANKPDAEAALAGTAAVLAPVGTLSIDGEDITIGTGDVGASATKLRAALTDLHAGLTPDTRGWLTEV